MLCVFIKKQQGENINSKGGKKKDTLEKRREKRRKEEKDLVQEVKDPVRGLMVKKSPEDGARIKLKLITMLLKTTMRLYLISDQIEY